MNYYNDNDPKICAWIRKLMKAKLIPEGEVDERSITEVKPDDIREFLQVHMFCGIGGWAEALRLAGISPDTPLWTGSCPCQPFSSAGKRQGTADDRHLWPEFFRLISECKPPIVFGEQVASKDGRLWLSGVRSDLETLGYAVGASDLCAASVAAPHIRQRLYWVAHAKNIFRERDSSEKRWERGRLANDNTVSWVADSKQQGRERCEQSRGTTEDGQVNGVCFTSGLDNSLSDGRGTLGDNNGKYDREQFGANVEVGGMGNAMRWRSGEIQNGQPRQEYDFNRTGENLNFWSNSIFIPCSDGKQRRISPEPGVYPLAYGVPGRVAMLKGFGNAIVPQVAAEFIKAYFDIFDLERSEY